VAFSLLLAVILAAAVVCVVGFARHGVNFLKYGFKQLVLDSSLEKRFDDLNARFDGIHDEIGGIHNEIGDLRNEIGGIHGEIDNIHGKIDRMGREFRTELGDLRGELKTIKVNHFGHLKSYLGVLNGILLDKGVIDNESKARLDNELRDM
jgi:peptidoglycan hydrolase CwlO-like protein